MGNNYMSTQEIRDFLAGFGAGKLSDRGGIVLSQDYNIQILSQDFSSFLELESKILQTLTEVIGRAWDINEGYNFAREREYKRLLTCISSYFGVRATVEDLKRLNESDLNLQEYKAFVTAGLPFESLVRIEWKMYWVVGYRRKK